MSLIPPLDVGESVGLLIAALIFNIWKLCQPKGTVCFRAGLPIKEELRLGLNYISNSWVAVQRVACARYMPHIHTHTLTYTLTHTHTHIHTHTHMLTATEEQCTPCTLLSPAGMVLLGLLGAGEISVPIKDSPDTGPYHSVSY